MFKFRVLFELTRFTHFSWQTIALNISQDMSSNNAPYRKRVVYFFLPELLETETGYEK